MFKSKLTIFVTRMMKKIFKYLFVYLSAAYFMFAGIGFNVINYCCSSCANRGIEAVAAISCDCIHHHDHTCCHHHSSDDDVSCDNVSHHPNGCHLLRLKVDVPSLQANIHFDVQALSTINLFAVSENVFVLESFRTIQYPVPPPKSDLLPSGRDILANNAILLI